MQSPHIPRKHNGSHSRQRLLHSCRLPKLAERSHLYAVVRGMLPALTNAGP